MEIAHAVHFEDSRLFNICLLRICSSCLERVSTSGQEDHSQRCLKKALHAASAQNLLESYFEACMTCLQLADWMSNHSL
jgi:hypothetical protein